MNRRLLVALDWVWLFLNTVGAASLPVRFFSGAELSALHVVGGTICGVVVGWMIARLAGQLEGRR